ncbi:MAG: hypothetical protein ACRECL_14200, partial [Bradyrhizobium sp.]
DIDGYRFAPPILVWGLGCQEEELIFFLRSFLCSIVSLFDWGRFFVPTTIARSRRAQATVKAGRKATALGRREAALTVASPARGFRVGR